MNEPHLAYTCFNPQQSWDTSLTLPLIPSSCLLRQRHPNRFVHITVCSTSEDSSPTLSLRHEEAGCETLAEIPRLTDLPFSQGAPPS
ncbi:uncharacterized protein V6R79_001695 [Siganus canaliculatus]